ncbi:polysaccharide deacetylase family protein [Bacillus alkalicola]|uniref:Polysaccharide deacetylase family protein n=2 Tax=Bacillales TaxID=1385 RepID=A0ABS6JTN1_9BACI|nr:polysaccharide deacetylase family protein [Bacillus alkalicola]
MASHPHKESNDRELDYFEPFYFNEAESISTDEVLRKWENKSLHSSEWGEHVSGVKNRLNTDDKVIALTFDACGGTYGSGYDEELISYLRSEEIPATLFFNTRWIKENKETFMELSNDKLFTIENHGTEHLPLSINGGTAWGIAATNSVSEVIEEVMGNQNLITELTGKSPSYFRSGTAFYDDIAVQIVEDLGLTTVNFNILGDAGATFTSSQVTNALVNATPGSIALLHMNRPESGTAAGVQEAIPILIEKGYEFVHLTDYELIE